MHATVTSIQGLSSQADLAQLNTQLSNNAFLTGGSVGDLQAAILALDLTQHSLGCAHLLWVHGLRYLGFCDDLVPAMS